MGPSRTLDFLQDESSKIGRWTDEEHLKFLEAYRIHGKDWRKLASYVGTRNNIQCRTHAQKHFKKLHAMMHSAGRFKVPGKSTTWSAQDIRSTGTDNATVVGHSAKDMLSSWKRASDNSFVQTSAFSSFAMEPQRKRQSAQCYQAQPPLTSLVQAATMATRPLICREKPGPLQNFRHPLPQPAFLPATPPYPGILLGPALQLQQLAPPLLIHLPTNIPRVFSEPLNQCIVGHSIVSPNLHAPVYAPRLQCSGHSLE